MDLNQAVIICSTTNTLSLALYEPSSIFAVFGKFLLERNLRTHQSVTVYILIGDFEMNTPNWFAYLTSAVT